jgi:transposase
VKVRRKDRYEYVSWAYADLAFKLMYKAALRGQRVVYVDPAYSSQECPVCGHVSKDNRDKRSHVFECEDCGFRSNDDRSAAMVLLGRGREKVLAELVEQGSSQPGFSQ